MSGQSDVGAVATVRDAIVGQSGDGKEDGKQFRVDATENWVCIDCNFMAYNIYHNRFINNYRFDGPTVG
jgi:hypothetical protein